MSTQSNNRKRSMGVMTRRGFLKGAAVTTVGTALGESALEALAQDQSSGRAVLGPSAVSIKLNVNGQDKRLTVEPRTTLAQALRDELDLTGTKVVCDRGSCSACTVWLDGQPVCSCMTLALDAVDRPVRTIEGLAIGEKLHPIQEAFIEHDAMQCGFCTPGMIMSCAHLLEHNTQPTLAEVKTAVSGNLCRCGTYPKVFDATLDAAKRM
jgi:aerobic-type carbon monoxide dehydrogenase small subunit (CoxS/CutS family)